MLPCAVCTAAVRDGRCPNVNCPQFSRPTMRLKPAVANKDELLFRCSGCGTLLPRQEVARHDCTGCTPRNTTERTSVGDKSAGRVDCARETPNADQAHEL